MRQSRPRRRVSGLLSQHLLWKVLIKYAENVALSCF